MAAQRDTEIGIAGSDFVNEWRVVEGHTNRRRGSEPDDSIAVIRPLPEGDKDQFEIGFRPSKGSEVKWVQTLRFNSRTGTLDDDDSRREGPDRCISFWDCKARGATEDRIFAMRRSKVGIGSSEPTLLDSYLPWELTVDKDGGIVLGDENGTWGAEGG